MHEPIEIRLNGQLGLLLPGGDGHRTALSFVVSDGRLAHRRGTQPEKLRPV